MNIQTTAALILAALAIPANAQFGGGGGGGGGNRVSKWKYRVS